MAEEKRSERVPLGDRMRAKRERPAPSRWLPLAEARAMGATVTEAATRAGMSRKGAGKAMSDPRFATLLRAAEERHRAAAERALARYRAEAVEALGASLTNEAIDPAERLAAARTLISASQPTTRAAEERAERALHARLARLDPDLAKQVAECLASEQRAELSSVSDEELDRALGVTS